MSRVLIAGCGDLGEAVGKLLARGGDRVWGLRRQAAELPSPIQPLAADLCRPETLAKLPEVATLVYCPAATQRSAPAYRRIYVEGLHNILAALSGKALERVLLVSSSSVYGQDAGEWVDEESPCRPCGFNGQVMLEAESELTRTAAGFTPVVLRLGGIYGPGSTRLLRRARTGGAVQARPPYWTNRIHRDDAAAMVTHLLQLPNPQPLYLGVDDEPATLWDVIAWLARALDAVPPLPGEGRGGNKRLSNKRIGASGFALRYRSYREGYRALVKAAEKMRY